MYTGMNGCPRGLIRHERCPRGLIRHAREGPWVCREATLGVYGRVPWVYTDQPSQHADQPSFVGAGIASLCTPAVHVRPCSPVCTPAHECVMTVLAAPRQAEGPRYFRSLSAQNRHFCHFLSLLGLIPVVGRSPKVSRSRVARFPVMARLLTQQIDDLNGKKRTVLNLGDSLCHNCWSRGACFILP